MIRWYHLALSAVLLALLFGSIKHQATAAQRAAAVQRCST